MKFYFCESCGKRLTEKEIDAGAAKDKKLRGVYCKTCAVGVTTMDTLPLSNQDAHKLVKEESTARPASSSTARNRRHSGGQLRAPGTGRPGDARSTSSRISARQAHPGKGSTMLWAGIGAAALIGAVLLALLLGGRPEDSSSQPRRIESKKQKPRPTPVASTTPPAKPDPAAGAFPSPQKKKTIPAREPEAATTAPGKTAQLDDAKAKKDVEPPDLASEKPSEQEPNNTAQQPTKQEEKKPDPEEAKRLTQARVVLRSSFEDFVNAVERLGIEDATRIGRAAEKDERLKPLADDARSLSLIGAALAGLHEKQQAAIRATMGKKLRLVTAKGAFQGIVSRVEGNTFHLKRTGKINNQTFEYSTPVKIGDLTQECRNRVLGKISPTTEHERMAVALEQLRNDDIAGAREALKGDWKHPLKSLLEQTLTTRWKAALEAEALAQWAKLEATSKRKLNHKQARALIADLETFERDYAETKLAAAPEHKAKRVALKAEVEPLAFGLDPRVVSLFKGRLEKYDPATQTLTAFYDCTKKEPLSDLRVDLTTSNQWRKVSQDDKGLRIYYAHLSRADLYLDMFRSGQAVIQMKCSDASTNSARGYLAIWFHADNSKGKAPAMELAINPQGMYLIRSTKEVNYRKVKTEAFATAPVKLPKTTSYLLEVGCKGNRYYVKVDDKQVIDYEAPEVNDHQGLRIGGGWQCTYTIKHLRVTGRLDPRWLAKKLSKK